MVLVKSILSYAPFLCVIPSCNCQKRMDVPEGGSRQLKKRMGISIKIIPMLSQTM